MPLPAPLTLSQASLSMSGPFRAGEAGEHGHERQILEPDGLGSNPDPASELTSLSLRISLNTKQEW